MLMVAQFELAAVEILIVNSHESERGTLYNLTIDGKYILTSARRDGLNVKSERAEC